MNKDFSKINFVIDFDSTFVKLEGLEELARISLKGNPQRERILNQISKITNSGMTGNICFEESLRKRIELFQPKRKHLEELIELLKVNITESIEQNIKFFQQNNSNIYVISGGFIEWILPVLAPYGISKRNIFANKFIYSNKNEIVGIDLSNPLTKSRGKFMTVTSLNLQNRTIVVGDGYTDFEIKKFGAADKFVMFTENIRRPSLKKHADLVVKDWNELLLKINELL